MTADALSLAFSALADPTRRAILARLANGEVPVKELAKPFRMSLPAISRHLKVLERGGLITRGRKAQQRPCKLHAGQMKTVEEWLEQHRLHWEKSFDRLGDVLKEEMSKQKAKQTNPKAKS
jgi:DNA-binding transcriptional ArsR family regulator